MPISNYIRRCIRLPIGTAVLLIALIGWGLQYKTSLYQEKYLHSPSPTPAKLLCETDRNLTAQCVLDSSLSTPSLNIADLHVLAANYEGELLRFDGVVQAVLQYPPLRHRPFEQSCLRAPPLS